MYSPFNQVFFRFPYYSFYRLTDALKEEDSLVEILNYPQFQEAIYIASPSFYDEAIKFLDNKLAPKEKEKTYYTLIRYLSRMCTRCTPFGLFSNVAMGNFDKNNNLRLNYTIKKTVRLDNYILNLLSRHVLNLEQVKTSTCYHTNTSLYQLNNKSRYIEYYYLNNKQRSHRIIEINNNPILNKIIEKAQKGLSYSEICNIITKEGYDKNTAEVYTNQVIDNQILISDLEPNITGSDYFNRLVSHLSSILDKEDKLLTKIIKIQSNLEVINNSTNENQIKLYKQTSELLYSIIPNLEHQILFQVDSLRETENLTISHNILKDIKKALSILNKLNLNKTNGPLNSFISAFYKRYENKEVSLFEALDPTLGIGYPPEKRYSSNYILDKFLFPNSSNNKINNQPINDIDKILLKKLYSFNSEKDLEINISDEDTAHLQENWENFPDTFCTIAEIINNKEVALKGTSADAGRLISRFAYLGQSFENLLSKIGNKEAELEPNSLVAEIVHLPDFRVGNILNRPLFRDYEIAYLTGLDYEQQKSSPIYLSDLYLSIINCKLKIRSKKLNKFIIPKLTNAHYYRSNPTPIYLFLSDYAHQDKRQDLFFSWGPLFQTLDFLPRVKYKNIILSPATWIILIEDIKKFFNYSNSELILALNNYLKRRKIPETVLLKESDNTLYVNFKSLTSIKSFWDYVKNKNTIEITEFYFDKVDNPAIQDFDGNGFSNECIISFYKEIK